MPVYRPFTIQQAVRYEMQSAWYVDVPTAALQSLVTRYILRKTKKKYAAYLESLDPTETAENVGVF